MLNRIGLWAVGPLYAAFMLAQVGYSVDVASATITTLTSVTINATGVITGDDVTATDDVTAGGDVVATGAVSGATVSASTSISTTGTGDISSNDDLTVTDDTTLTDSLTVNGAVTLGSNDVDDITIKGPVVFDVRKENFSYPAYTASSTGWSNMAVTDTGQNFLVLPSSPIGFIAFRFEQAYGGSIMDFIDNGYLFFDTDDTDNDGIDIVFGAGDFATTGHVTGIFDEDSSSSVYCEASVLITDISETDSFYFGMVLDQVFPDGGAWASNDTYALFVLSDGAGDLDIVTELNAGGSLNDDTGVTWADGNEKVLRVTVSADTVSFTLDGSPVTQANAVLNFDDGDRVSCRAGWLNSTGDATPDPDIKFNYVEYGVSQ